MRKLLLILLTLASMGAGAASVAVCPTSSGDGSGSDWNNCAQWSSVTPVRGDTLYLKGNSTYGAKTLSTANSGTTRITIKKCQSGEGTCTALAGFSSANDSEAIFAGNGTNDVLTINTDYWTIDGYAGGGPGAWTSEHGIKFTRAAGGGNANYIVTYNGATGLVFSRLKFEETGNVDVQITGMSGFYTSTGGEGSISNSTFQYLYFTNLGQLPWVGRGGSGNIFQYNYVGHICGAYIADAPLYLNVHCEAVVWHDMDDVHFRWNFLTECPSSGCFVKNDTETSDGIYIYGNVFGVGHPIYCNLGTCTNWRIFNNTFHDLQGGPIGYDSAPTGTYIHNNIIYRGTTAGLIGTHDYNWYSNGDSTLTTSYSMGESANENICDQCGGGGSDSVTTTTRPFVNDAGTTPESWKLTARITGASGTNVCTLVAEGCTATYQYNKDAFGNTRTNWDRGAYEFAGGLLPAPTNLRARPVWWPFRFPDWFHQVKQ